MMCVEHGKPGRPAMLGNNTRRGHPMTLSKIRNAPYAILAAATVALYSSSAVAEEGKTIGAAADTFKESLVSVGKLVVLGAVLGGVVMIGAGLMKLKQASDTQGQQTKYSEGLWRLAVGAGLVAIPALSGMLTASVGITGAAIGNPESTF